MARFRFPFPRNPSPYPQRRRYPRRVGIVGAIALLIAAIAGGIGYNGRQAPAAPAQPPQQQRTTTVTAPHAPPAAAPATATAAVYETTDGGRIDDPDEVREIGVTIADILDGPPDRYRPDRDIWENRGSRLPSKPRGFWREFTVVTPGSPDRGPRRLVWGGDGSLYFTRDHYRTFVRLVKTLPPQ